MFAKVKVHFNANNFSTEAPVVLTIGTFDGVHVGHRAVLDLLKTRASEIKGESVLLTFHPHPRTVLYPEHHKLHLLNTIQERQSLLDQTGLDHLIIHPFTERLSRMTPLEYVREIFAEGIRPSVVIVGYDHRFGRNREGSFESLINLGKVFDFEVEELPAHTVENTRVSSTKVREAIANGDMARARMWLGQPYPLAGRVIRGEQLGRKLGFPTANLDCEETLKQMPGRGVYAVWARIAGVSDWQPAIVNMGTRPTVQHHGVAETMEVHMLEGGRQCYDETIELLFIERLRDEMKFKGLKALQNQLQQDALKARSLLANEPAPLE
ncbi:MAG TPA: riboflavin biosynthesis protein RibF [Flavobacteriales bacterium]|nr:riboflavin biosynthesis protein RibF [Flavobacteriales bacterium]